jgi:hypothetical protein
MNSHAESNSAQDTESSLTKYSHTIKVAHGAGVMDFYSASVLILDSKYFINFFSILCLAAFGIW